MASQDEPRGATDQFPTETEGLPQATRPAVEELADGDMYELKIGAVRKQIEGSTVRMLAYSGSIPGPTLRVSEGAKVSIRATNRGDHETTVHWHGLRLDNRYDGTHETQAAIPVGGTFSYELTFPDPGVYWYHPHIREDYGQELGLYGNIVVVPADPDYWPPVDRELLLTLDDVLIENGAIAAFSTSETTHVAMGRFGNVMLVSGEADLSLTASRGEVVRLFLTNTANTRVFNVTLPGARMKLVGADSGRYEREEYVDEVLIAPSERVVVDVLFDQSGDLALTHRTPDREYRLARITVREDATETTSAGAFATQRPDSASPFHGTEITGDIALPVAFVRTECEKDGPCAHAWRLGESAHQDERKFPWRTLVKLSGQDQARRHLAVPRDDRRRLAQGQRSRRGQRARGVARGRPGRAEVDRHLHREPNADALGRSEADLHHAGLHRSGHARRSQDHQEHDHRDLPHQEQARHRDHGLQRALEPGRRSCPGRRRHRSRGEERARAEAPIKSRAAPVDSSGRQLRRGEGTFELRDVPYVEYFEAGYALHAAYWHDVFGKARSHGCVNLAPIDAQRVFGGPIHPYRKTGTEFPDAGSRRHLVFIHK